MQILARTCKTITRAGRLFIFALALVALMLPPLHAQTTPPQATQIKGVFLYNFATFTEWPPVKFTNTSSPFVIAILGDDPFGQFLDAIVKDERIDGHPIEIHRYASIEDLDSCHILFVERGQSERLEEVLQKVQGKNILTVSDIEDFTYRGGIVRFYLEDNKMRFQVNMSAMNATDLTLSSRLLRLANICCVQNNR